LITRVSVKDGKLRLPNGVQSSALGLRNTANMTLSKLKKLDQLSRGGAVIIGTKPKHLAGYGNAKHDFATFKTLAENVWKRPTTYQK